MYWAITIIDIIYYVTDRYYRGRTSITLFVFVCNNFELKLSGSKMCVH